MKNQRTFFWCFGFLFIIQTLGPVAQGATKDLPDEMNVPKYSKLYQEAKLNSDAKRTRANELLAQAQLIDQKVDETQSLLNQKQSRLEWVRSTLIQLKNDNPQLENQIITLGQEIERLQDILNSNNVTLASLNRDYKNLTDALSAQQSRVNARQRDFDGAQAEVNSTQSSLEAEKENLTLLLDQLQKAFNRKREIENEMQNNTVILRNLDQEIANLNPRVAALASQLAQLDRQVSQLQSELGALEKQIQPYTDAVNVARKRLSDLSNSLANAQRKVDDLAKKIQTLDQQITQADSQLTKLNQQLQDQNAELAALPSNISNLESEISAKTARRDQVLAELKVNQLSLRNLQQKSQEVQRLIREKKTRLNVLMSNPAANKDEIEKLKTEIVQLEEGNKSRDAEIARLSSLNTQLNQESDEINKKTLPGLQGLLKTMKTRQAALPGEINKLKAQIQTQEAQRKKLVDARTSLLRDKQTADQELANAKAASVDAQAVFDKAQSDLEKVLPPVREKRQQLTAAQTARAPVSQEYSKLSSELRDSQARQQQLRQRNNVIASEIRQLAQDIPGLQYKADITGRSVTDLQNRLAAAQARLSATGNALSVENQRLQALQAQFNDLRNRMDQLNQSNTDLMAQIQARKDQISQNRETIQKNQETIAALTREQPVLEKEIPSLSVRLSSLQADSVKAWDAFQPADTAAVEAEKVTKIRYDKLIAVQTLYDSRLQAARDEGVRQGRDQGSDDGEAKGKTDGTKAGAEKGSATGREEGLLAGFQNGVAAGTTQGDQEGYQHGVQASENYSIGFTEGQTAGVKLAYEFAHQTEYPRGAENKKKELMSVLPAHQLILDNRNRVVEDQSVVKEKSFWDSFKSILNEKSAGASSALLSQSKPGDITGAKDSVEVFYSLESQGSDGKTTLFARAAINLQLARCEMEYADFTNACLESFKASYRESFDQAYVRAQKTAYDEAFPAARLKAFDENKTVRFKEGFDRGYPEGYAIGDARGAADAKNRGYLDGKKKGYDDTLELAKSEEFSKGASEMQARFEDEPMLLIKGFRLDKLPDDPNPKVIVAGDTLSLTMNIVNFGKRAAPRKMVKVKIEALSEKISTENTLSEIIELPAETVAQVIHIAFAKVSPEALGIEELKVRVTAYLPDQNPLVQDLSITTTPNIVGVITDMTAGNKIEAGKKTKLYFRVKNVSSKDATSDMRVVASSRSSAVRIDRAEMKFGKAKAGQTIKDVGGLFNKKALSVEFTVLDAQALGQGIPVKLILFHGELVAGTAEFVLKN